MKFDIIAIGTATRDVFLQSPLFKVVRDPKHLEKLGFPTGEAECFALGAKIEIEKPVFTVGGGAANAAVTFARQGFKTAVAAKIGKDAAGEGILNDLKKEKITSLARFDKRGTAYSSVLLSPSGERTILVYRGASDDLRISDVAASQLKTKWAYIAPGHIDFNVMVAIIKVLRKNGARIAMNPSSHYLKMGTRKLAPLLRELDVIFVNREEAAYLTGYAYHEEKKIFKKFDELVQGIAVMTDGPKGVLVSDGRAIYRAGTFKGKVADRTGAGDAFGSGFVSGLISRQLQASSFKLLDKKAIEYAIRLGTANATSVVERIGAQEGILTRSAFRAQARFRRLAIRASAL